MAHQLVAEVVEGPLVLRKVGGREPVAHHHVHSPVQHLGDHFRGKLRRIGVVPVHHQVALGVDLPEHAADHVALALLVLMAHHSPGSRGDLRRAVGGVVVIYINDAAFRQHRLEVRHHLGNGFALIIAGNQYRYLIHALSSCSNSSPNRFGKVYPFVLL